jgi:major membrane immunogen (membrane-anchored lipoprotein)
MASETTTLPAKSNKGSVSAKDASYIGNMTQAVALSPEQGLNRYLSQALERAR